MKKLLPAKYKKQWLKNLETHEKCEGMLRHGDTFCVAGVFADVLVQNGIGEWVKRGGYRYQFERNKGYALIPLQALAQISKDPVKLDHYINSLYSKNDKGWSFKRLAKKIEKDL